MFHTTIFARMKSEDGHASTGFQAGGQLAQKPIESAKFVVHRNAQRLKHAAHTVVDALGIESGLVLAENRADRVGELGCA